MRKLAPLAPIVVVMLAAGCGSDDPSKRRASSAPEPAPPPGQTQTDSGAPPGHGSSKGPPPQAAAPALREGSPPTVTTPQGIAEPKKVDDSGKQVAHVVKQVLGPDISMGEPTVIGSHCDGGNCTIRYRSEARGAGLVFADQSRLLQRLFRRRSVQRVTLYVHHQQVGTPGKNEAPAFATAICHRASHPRYVCEQTHVAGGKQRSLVRRGLLTNEQASRGQGR